MEPLSKRRLLLLVFWVYFLDVFSFPNGAMPAMSTAVTD
jgi:hypothetical protein